VVVNPIIMELVIMATDDVKEIPEKPITHHDGGDISRYLMVVIFQGIIWKSIL